MKHIFIAAALAFIVDSIYPWMGLSVLCIYPVALMWYRGMVK